MCASKNEEPQTPEKWKRPDEVMRMYNLRMKKKALQARMNRTENPLIKPTNNVPLLSPKVSEKRKNPFGVPNNSFSNDSLKRVRDNELELDECSNDQTLFKLLNLTDNSRRETTGSICFANILNKLNDPSKDPQPKPLLKKGTKVPPVDWTLRTKVRFMSKKPFAWNENLRTCEEASGITGFVRCLDTEPSATSSLDSSPSARFHQCCLVWQHPILPWLELYPRTGKTQKLTDSKIPPVTGQPGIRESLQRDWEESFRSLYQLVRARQCPYFYLLTHTFSCLFRAAGICGHPTINALISPTSRGFRQILKDEDIEFTMPLKTKNGSPKSADDTGYDTLETTQNSQICTDDIDEGEEAEEWLHSMGVEAAEIKRMSYNQEDIVLLKEKKLDKTPESLVCVQDTEVNLLFNFLLNCKSSVPSTGPLTGVPPTLLAPVAFHGATLRPLKVRESVVKVESNRFFSMEVKGPILPTTIHNLCNLLSSSLDQFSLTFANLDSTKPFTTAGHANVCDSTREEKEGLENIGSESNASCTENQISNSAFEEVNLSDCGLPNLVLKSLCNKESNSVQLFDSLKFSDKVYSWT
uniref:Protein downstream neighbor of son homolog n=1 Tax=Clastoptera arizonana TaxID=38151 RepID=A0A1B6CQY5_9HEMI